MLATPELITEAMQPQRLAQALPRYVRQAPLYRSAAALLDGQSWPGLVGLRRLPFITKEDIRRDFPRNFLGEGANLDALLEREVIELEHTSGTSEERTALLLPRNWWTEQEARALRLNPAVAAVLGAKPGARRVTICSPVCSGELCFTGVPSRDERMLGDALFVSLSRYPFLWSESDLARMAEEAREWQPQYLDVDPVYGAVFALYCERRRIRLPSLQFILSSYEYASVNHRRILQRAFGVPVIDLYGSTETGHLLIETERSELRASLETAYLEIVDPDEQGIGELVVTTLTNSYMPLIRYRIGDLAASFERAYGTRYSLHGRVADAFAAPRGRVTTRQIDECFLDVPGILHYQLVQREKGPWLLRYVPEGEGLRADTVAHLQQNLRTCLGLEAPLEMQATDVLVPENSGKFRLGYPMPKRR